LRRHGQCGGVVFFKGNDCHDAFDSDPRIQKFTIL
jgi:hypothetical protein